MKQLDLAEAQKYMHTLFSGAQREMFKAEVLQDYSQVDDGPSLRAWLRNDREESLRLGKVDESIVTYRGQCLASPAKITRVHVVEKPYTPYLQWEIAVCYKGSLLAGGAEKIFLVDADRLTGMQLPAGDFWIFDGSRVLQWVYENGVGKTVGGILWDEEAGDDIGYFCKLKEKLLLGAEPITL